MSASSHDNPLAIQLVGVAPLEHPLAVENRAELIYLLREAAELEHGIMCQYLFAAFSLKQSAAEGLTPEQLDAVGRWRKVLSEVARQEMLHLALVQNLLIAIGAAPHLGRPNLPTSAPYFPRGVSLALVPFGERALRHFLYLERPEGMPLEDAEDFATVADHAQPITIASDDAIVPHAQEFATVGHLYRAIDIGFAWLTSRLGADRLFVGPASAQATPESFRWPELVRVSDLRSAHAAIDTIVNQGEGVRGEWRTAHFGRFLRLLEEFLALRQAVPSFEPARPVCAGTVRPREDAPLPVIDNPVAAQVADLFDAVNETLLVMLTRYFAASDESSAERELLAETAVRLMFAAIRPLGQALTVLPFGPSRPNQTAGPVFWLVPQDAALLPHRTAAWILIEERLREAAEFGRTIAAPETAGLNRVCDALERYANALHAKTSGG